MGEEFGELGQLTMAARLPRSRPPHLTGDGEATPTKQAPVTTQVVLTTVRMFGAPGRLTTAVHPRHGAVRVAATVPNISKIYTTQGMTQGTTSTRTGPSRRISVRSCCSIHVRLPVSIRETKTRRLQSRLGGVVRPRSPSNRSDFGTSRHLAALQVLVVIGE
jgi:hypothetical protein